MILAWVLVVAQALDLDDEAWNTEADGLLHGPAGCWEVLGQATWSHDLGRWGATRGDAVFAARLQDGVWGEIAVFPRGEVVTDRSGDVGTEYGDRPRFTPLVGRVRGLAVRLDGDRRLQISRSKDPRVDPVNTVADLIGKRAGQVTLWAAYWDEARDGVMLSRSLDVGRGDAPLEVRALFPQGRRPAERWELMLKRPYVHDGWIPARVTDLRVRIAGERRDEVVLPAWESMRFELRLTPLVRLQAAQTIRYTAVSPCP